MSTTKKLSRQKRALTMLEATLKSGVKTPKTGGVQKLVLTDHDKTRINAEVVTLKASIVKG